MSTFTSACVRLNEQACFSARHGPFKRRRIDVKKLARGVEFDLDANVLYTINPTAQDLNEAWTSALDEIAFQRNIVQTVQAYRRSGSKKLPEEMRGLEHHASGNVSETNIRAIKEIRQAVLAQQKSTTLVRQASELSADHVTKAIEAAATDAASAMRIHAQARIADRKLACTYGAHHEADSVKTLVGYSLFSTRKGNKRKALYLGAKPGHASKNDHVSTILGRALDMDMSHWRTS